MTKPFLIATFVMTLLSAPYLHAQVYHGRVYGRTGRSHVAVGQEEPSHRSERTPQHQDPDWVGIGVGILNNVLTSEGSHRQREPQFEHSLPVFPYAPTYLPPPRYQPTYVWPPSQVTRYPTFNTPPSNRLPETTYLPALPSNSAPYKPTFSNNPPVEPLNFAPAPTPVTPVTLSLNPVPAAFSSIKPLTKSQLASADRYITEQADEDLDELESILGSSDLLDEARDALAAGEALGPDWADSIKESLDQAAKDAKTEATASIEDMKSAAAGDGALEKLMDGALKDVKNGKPLPKDFPTKVADAAKAAGKTPDEVDALKDMAKTASAAGKAAADAVAAKAQGKKLATAVAGAVAAKAIVKEAIAAKFASSLIPAGSTNILLMPALPKDAIYVLPGGAVMTGGSGSIAVITGTVADMFDVPLGVGPPLADASGATVPFTSSGILLRNPEANSAPIRYLIDASRNYTLVAGYSQQLDGRMSRRIRFSRGVGSAQATYDLAEGTYAFSPSSKGWDLFQQSFRVTIDNTDGDQDFAYAMDNRLMKVSPGRTRTHTSIYPIVIRFNRGAAGEEAVKRITSREEQLQVAVSPADGLWDLFPMGALADDPIVDSSPASLPGGVSEPRPEKSLASVLGNN